MSIPRGGSGETGPGGHQETFRAQDIDYVTTDTPVVGPTSISAATSVPTPSEMPTSLRIAIESNDQLNANTTIYRNVDGTKAVAAKHIAAQGITCST